MKCYFSITSNIILVLLILNTSGGCGDTILIHLHLRVGRPPSILFSVRKCAYFNTRLHFPTRRFVKIVCFMREKKKLHPVRWESCIAIVAPSIAEILFSWGGGCAGMFCHSEGNGGGKIGEGIFYLTMTQQQQQQKTGKKKRKKSMCLDAWTWVVLNSNYIFAMIISYAVRHYLWIYG